MSEFPAGPAPVHLGDPASDPPMVVRVHPDDDPRSPGARRAIIADVGTADRWCQVTGSPFALALTDDDVAAWPVQHAIVYGTVYRHAAAADAREAPAVAPLAGDDLAGPDGRLFR